MPKASDFSKLQEKKLKSYSIKTKFVFLLSNNIAPLFPEKKTLSFKLKFSFNLQTESKITELNDVCR